MTTGASSSSIPPSPFESMEYVYASQLRTKHTKDGGVYHQTVRRPLRPRATVPEGSRDNHLVQDSDINAVSLDEWVIMNRLSFHRDKLKDCASSVAKLWEIGSIEIKEVARHFGMRLAFL